MPTCRKNNYRYKKNDLLFIICLFLIIIFASNCNPCDDNSYLQYRKDSILIRNIDNSGKKPIYPIDNRVSAKAFGISLDFFRTLLINNRDKNGECLSKTTYENNVIKFNISSLNNFDSTHLANTNLNDYFFWKYSSFTGNPQPMSTIVNELNKKSGKLTFLLIKEPVLDSIHQFFILIELSNNNVMVDTTEQVTLF